MDVAADAILKEIQARYPQEFLISVQAVRIASVVKPHERVCMHAL